MQSGVYAAFTAKLVAAVRQLRVGDGLAGPTEQGPLIDEKAVAKVEEHLADALAKGAAPQAIADIVLKTQWMTHSNRARLQVLDQGSGFADHILKRAFEPYVTTKRSGTGLGLAVVKKIADDHGSRIEITNRMAGATVVGAQVSLSLACTETISHMTTIFSDHA